MYRYRILHGNYLIDRRGFQPLAHLNPISPTRTTGELLARRPETDYTALNPDNYFSYFIQIPQGLHWAGLNRGWEPAANWHRSPPAFPELPSRAAEWPRNTQRRTELGIRHSIRQIEGSSRDPSDGFACASAASIHLGQRSMTWAATEAVREWTRCFDSDGARNHHQTRRLNSAHFHPCECIG